MEIAVDIGNSRVKVHTFAHGEIVRRDVFSTRTEHDHLVERLEKLIGPSVNQVGIASVVPEVAIYPRDVVRDRLGIEPIMISASMGRLPFEMGYEQPEHLGADRIAGAAGALARYGSNHLGARTPLIVVDAGTAVNYEVITTKPRYLGGSIAPGPRTMASALASNTGQLPDVELAVPYRALGTSTESCLQSGIMYSLLDSVRGMVDRLWSEVEGNPEVIVTGGYGRIVADNLENVLFDEDLVAEGIRSLMRLNA